MKIGTKLMAIITAVNLIGIGGLTISSVVFASRQSTKLAKETIVDAAVNTADLVQLYLEVAMDEIRAVAQIAGHLDEFPLEERRLELDFMLQSLTKENPDFVGVWAAFEANALDGRDSFYVNTYETDETGRFQSYYKNENGKVTIEALGNFSAEDYYRV